MRTTVAEFDPYQAWLRIQQANRPLNAYQLLGLKDLESDQARIQAAIERQTISLDRCRAGADEQLWERINDELAEATRTLLDPELKAVLDGTLRRSQRAPAATTAGDSGAGGSRGAIECSQCGDSNAGNRRFCGSCGKSLWEKCPQCSTECSCEERFCGHCGFDIRSGVEQRSREYQQLLEEARRLADNHRYDSALSRFRKLAAIDDKRFEAWAQCALEEIAKTEQRATDLKLQAEQSLEAAQRFLAEYAYEQAIDALVCVPEPVRSEEIQQLLQQARDAKAELATLNSQIRQAVAQKSLWNLLPLILRLLTLKPDDAPIQKLALQLRDHFVKLAKTKVVAHEYAEAGQALQQIAPFARTEEVEALCDKAQELECLMQALRYTAIADQGALALGRKLMKYAPSNHVAQKIMTDLEQRARVASPDPRLAAPNINVPPRTPVGPPVDWLGHSTSVGISRPEVETTLRKHPGQFFVALGLALQGLDETHISIQLNLPEKSGVLGKLSLSRLRAKPSSAWGLDLGNFGLKAVKLVRDAKSGQVQIDCCEYIAHSIPLTAPSAEMERGSIQERTLRAFLERVKLDGSRVVVSIPGQRVLGRFFELPPLPAAKIAGAIQYEAKHQLPIALDELCWAYQQLGTSGHEEDQRGQNILLVAARQSQVRDCLAPFKNAGIAIDIVQSDCLALHNSVHREFFNTTTNEAGSTVTQETAKRTALGPGDVLAFVDLGAEGANVVFSSQNTMWFRSFGLGGHSFTNALVRQLQLTYEQAEQWKCDPARARRFYQYHSAVQPIFAQLSGELERSIASYRKLYPTHSIRHIYGMGGAFPTHGLLRQLRFGQ